MEIKMSKLYFLTLLITCFNWGQAQFQTNGSAFAVVTDTCYRLTQAVNGQNGSVWNVNQVDLSENFEILADLYFGTSDAGADGIVFAFQQVSVSAGASGGGMGIQGVQPSLFVPFDTYQNGSDLDPTQDHVSINRNGDTNHGSINNLAGPIQASASNANIEDGISHLVLIRWLVDNIANTQTMEVYFDCVLRVTATGNFINSTFNNNPNVFWGFTAATGGLNNEHSFCFQYVSALTTNLGDQTTCIGDGVQIAAPPIGSNYAWTPATGLSNPNIENPIASPNVTTTYTVSISNICNNVIQDSLTVFVLDTNQTNLNEVICEGESVFAEGAFQSTSGVYIDTFINQNGCDSIVKLDLSVLDTSITVLIESICENSSYNFNGQFINASGSYTDTLLNSNACDSIVTLQLTILSTDTLYEDTLICSGSSFIWNGQNINSAGVYDASYINSQGCDSTLYLTVTQDDVNIESVSVSICASDSVFLNNDWQNTSGIYIDTFRYQISQCDSLVRTTDLSVLDTSQTVLNESICENESYNFNGQLINTSGTYTVTLLKSNGCDSIVSLLLTVLSTDTLYGDTVICSGSSFIWNGQNINSAGVYDASYVNSQGCDSTLYFTVTQDEVSFESVLVSICTSDSLFLDNAWQNTSGIYIDTFKYQISQCDSLIRTTDLTVLPFIFSSIDTFICFGDSLAFKNSFISSAGSYTDTLNRAGNCDEVVEWTVSVFSLPTSEIVGPASFCVEDGSELLGFSNSPSINWLPSNSNENPLIITGSSLYILESIDTAGCIGRDSLQVTALEDCYLLMLPTAFSPNQDGVNDIFIPLNLPEAYYIIDIYNRYGELIFRSEDSYIGWDGFYKGNAAGIGVYPFNISYKFKIDHEMKSLNGSLTLIR
jgi:gliding motility-associated-like protein